MATTSRQASLFALQDWQQFYQTAGTDQLQSYDYETLRKSFIDYIQRNYPENFNDWIESSEFVALLDVIAYMGQALAFRGDLNYRENFLDTAQRRDSVIKLANLVSYNPKRNTAGQGLVKVTAISTTENIIDINGINLSNTTILWNDPANSSWQEQFNTVLNSALINSQRIGKPGNSQVLLGVKTDEYTVNLPPDQLPVIPYQSEVDGTVMNFELVSVSSLGQNYLYELPPAPTSQFNMLYRNDRLGYSSPNTGFFFYFKQGTLQSVNFLLPEKIENNLQPINIQGINNTDTWLYKLDAQGAINQLWTQVESVYTAAANTQGNSVKTIFSVVSRANDEVTYAFSDGVFGEIPVGPFRAYVRSSNALQYSIDPSEMGDITASVNYISRQNKLETLTFTFSLQTPSNTAQNRESLTSIKERAPSRYYTQNRMVNGGDYTNFPYTLYSSIIKSKAVNRSSIGVSRNLDLLDPTGKYSSTNVFAVDGGLVFNNTNYTGGFSTSSSSYALEFLTTSLPTLLSSAPSIQYYQTYYDRKNAAAAPNDFKWNLTSVIGGQVTGYFFTTDLGSGTPIPVGVFSTSNAKWITKGAQVKFEPIAVGMYFDDNNRLTTVNTGRSYIWVGVDGIVGDGYNFGKGNLATGVGPITLDQYVPSGVRVAAVDSIIPPFQNTLTAPTLQAAQEKIRLTQDFVLMYDDTFTAANEHWSVAATPATDTATNWFVKFIHNSVDSTYTVLIRNVNYYFASVDQVRFLFNGTDKVYDPVTGTVIADQVKIIPTLANQSSYLLWVIGQPVLSNGFTDDYQVTVSPIDVNTGYSQNPDFFNLVLGQSPAWTPVISSATAVFYRIATNSSGLTNKQLLPPGTVIYNASLNTLDLVNNVVYEYATESIFYCTDALSVTLSAGAPVGSTYVATATTGLPHKLSVGNTITIRGSSTAANVKCYYGTYTVTTVPSTTSFTYTFTSTVTPLNGQTATVVDRFYQSSVVPGSVPVLLQLTDVTASYMVECGRGALSYQYQHNTNQSTRIDPATTNIIDIYVITQAYYTAYINWLSDTTGTVPRPTQPTISELEQSYSELNSYKMISDSVVLNSVTFKPLFGTKAEPGLQGTIKIVKSPRTTVSDTQIRSSVLSAMNTYFSINNWDFGATFYFSELTAYLHSQLVGLISSVVLVPADPAQKFGDLYEIRSQPDEIFVNGATANDIVIISALTAQNMNR